MARYASFGFALCAWLGAGVAYAASTVHPHLPDGFVDLTHGIPDNLKAEAPPAWEDEAKKEKYVAFAMDPVRAPDGTIASVVGVRLAFPMLELSALVSGKAEFLAALAKSYPPGTELEMLSATEVKVDRQTAQRLELVAKEPIGSFGQLVYFMPAGKDLVSLTFSVGQGAFAAYEPRFDAAAQATTGLEAQPRTPGWFETSLPGIIGTSVGVAGIPFVLARQKKRKAKAAAAAGATATQPEE